MAGYNSIRVSIQMHKLRGVLTHGECYNLGPDLDDPEMKDTLRLYVFVTRHHVKRPFVYK